MKADNVTEYDNMITIDELNTDKYSENVTKMLAAASTKEEALEALDQIEEDLWNGTFKY